MSKTVISKENAQLQMDQLLEWYGIDEDNEEGSEKVAAISARKKLKTGIVRGLTGIREDIDKDGDSTLLVFQKLKRPIKAADGSTAIEEIVYKELTGKAKRSIKQDEDDGELERIYQLLGKLSGHDSGVFDKLKGPDVGIAEAIGTIFLLS